MGILGIFSHKSYFHTKKDLFDFENSFYEMKIETVSNNKMGIGPVLSSQKALKRAGLELKDIDIIEMNEAFAAQSLACIDKLGIDTSKLNMHGGAIAMGHPLGASGARITGKAAALLQNSDAKYALSTMCVGGGQGCATVLERG